MSQPQIPGQLEIPGMPAPIEKPPPEPVWVTARISVELEVKIDVAGALADNRANPSGLVDADNMPVDWKDLTDEWLRTYGYGPGEKLEVFTHNYVAAHVEAYVGGEFLEEQPFWTETEVDIHWTDEMKRQVWAALGE